MKRLLSLVLSVLLVLSVISTDLLTMTVKAATSGTTGDCLWTLENGVLTISGEGAMKNYNDGSTLPWQEGVREVIIEEGVTSIGRNAFANCSSLSSITLPASVKFIEYGAFEGCSGLTKVHITDLTAWCELWCANLESHPLYYAKNLYLNNETIVDLIVPDGVTSIGVGAFYGRSELNSVHIPNSVTYIGKSAFYGCSNLKKVQITDVGAWCSTYFYDLQSNPLFYAEALYLNNEILTEVVIPDGVQSIGAGAFYGCSELTSISLPKGIYSIGAGAFYGCTGLSGINLPERVAWIGLDAFGGCSGLTKVSITNLVAWCKIDFHSRESNPLLHAKDLYLNGVKITKLVVPQSITRIEDYAFSGCSGLTSISLHKSVASIGDYAFYGCCGLTSISLPNGVTSIGVHAFASCSALTSISIPNSVTSIGYSPFGNCNSLTSIKVPFVGSSRNSDEAFGYLFGGGFYAGSNYYYTIPSSVRNVTITDATQIPTNAFSRCYMLTNITINDGVCNIGSSAFASCSGLTSINIPTSVTNIGASAFHQNIREIWYEGSADDREQITLGSNNTTLINATWHYNTCKQEHTFSNSCDASCELCEWIREIVHTYDGDCDKECNVCHEERTSYVEHSYTLNGGYTCEICKESKRPEIPILQSKTNSSVSLVAIDGFEYSKDGITWQTSNLFTELSPNTNYVFYQRVKKSAESYESAMSEGLLIRFKLAQSIPTAPTISSYTDTMVTLIPVLNVEYSNDDGETWQTSNVFTGLSSGTKYIFYQRYVETDTHEASNASAGTIVTTDKSKQTLIPAAPTVQSVTSSSITLVAVDGCEYSKNGTTWQSSTVFGSLSCGTEYTFYQRYKETSSTYAGKSSVGTIGSTDKGTQSVPAKPTLSGKTHNSVTLTLYNGYEYSMDGINWQTSNVFTGLNPETNYLFYQRKAETDKYYASEVSSSLTVKTKEMFQSITVSTLPNNTSYLEGKDKLDLTGGKISLCYSDGSMEEVVMTADMVTGFDNSIVGNQKLVVNYEGYTTTFTVQVVAKSVTSIEITTKPTKLTYLEGDAFDKSGMIVTVYYNNNTGAVITDYTVTGDLSTKGIQTITVEYGGKTTTLTIEVLAAGEWKFDGTGWWYLNSNGTYPANCWKEIDNVWYYFNASGYIVTGWKSIGGTWYYFTGSGAMVTGWQSIGGTWYYFTGSGAMVTGWQQIDGTWYYFTGGGAMVTGWKSVGGTWYYFEGSGAMVANRWVGNYYLQSDGSMATNKWIGSYYVGADGVWIP